MTNKKVGLLLAQGTNYGALLQSYATQQIVKKLGFETCILNYRSSRNDIFKNDIGIIWHLINTRFSKRNNKKPIQKLDELHRLNKDSRKKAQEKFLLERFENRLFFDDYNELNIFCKQLCAVLIGSDQSWLPGSMFNVMPSMRFVPNGTRRISYSTSLGVSEYPRYCWKTARKVWEKMDFLSVREEQGKEIIRQICGDIPVQVVCDPTYLFTKQEWEEMIPVNRLENEKYVLCYFLGTDTDLFRIARSFVKAKGLKLISILTCEVCSEGDADFADKTIIGASPEDFVNYIRGAEYILTDSFHGTAFSVINEKQFFLFYPKREYLKQSRNSRLDNIVNMWNLGDRLIKDKNINWDSIDIAPIDYSLTTKIVMNKRNESLDFITKALLFND